MKTTVVALILVVALATTPASCTSGGTVHYIDTAELEAAKTELHQAQTAVAGCLYDSGMSQLDSAAWAWDGSPGQVTCTAGIHIYDAADYLHSTAFKATYDVDVNGVIVTGHNVSWLGVRWDNVSKQWAAA